MKRVLIFLFLILMCSTVLAVNYVTLPALRNLDRTLSLNQSENDMQISNVTAINGTFDNLLVINPPVECPSGSFMTYTNMTTSICIAESGGGGGTDASAWNWANNDSLVLDNDTIIRIGNLSNIFEAAFNIGNYSDEYSNSGFDNENESDPDSLHLTQDNWGDDGWINWVNPNFAFNQSKFEIIYYSATQSGLVAGTLDDSGGLNQTNHTDGNYDGNTFNFTEASGSPALDLRINFTGIEDFTQGVMRYYTSELAGDSPIIQMWNYGIGDWEDYPYMIESLSYATITQPVFDSDNHLENEIAQMRIYKASNGNTNNHYFVDWIAIAKGFGVPSGEEIDPDSIHTDAINHSQFNYEDGQLNVNISYLDLYNQSITNLYEYNYSLDLSNYFIQLDIFNHIEKNITSSNTSMKAYIDSNPFSWITATVSTLTNYFTIAATFTHMENNITSNNASLVNHYAPLDSPTFTTAFTATGLVDIGDIGVDAVSDSELDGGFSWTLDSDLNINSNTLFVDQSASFVGIGTATPSKKLHIAGSLMIDNDLYLGGEIFQINATSLNINETITLTDTSAVEQVVINASGVSWFNGGNVGIGTTGPTSKLHVIGSANVTGTVYAHNFSGNSNISFLNASGDEIVRFTDSGNVGIGTTSPTSELHVVGDVNITGNLTSVSVSATNQPSFTAYLTATVTDVTGDDTIYDITGAIWTEITDVGGHFSDGLFTAPETGTYLFTGVIVFEGVGAAHTYGWASLTTTSKVYYFFNGLLYGGLATTGGTGTASFGFVVPMTAADTAKIQVAAYSGTKIVDVTANTVFTGYKLP